MNKYSFNNLYILSVRKYRQLIWIAVYGNMTNGLKFDVNYMDCGVFSCFWKLTDLFNLI